MSAAADLARCLWVMEICLVDVVGSVPPIPGTTEGTRHHDIQKYFYEMGRARFTAVRDGHLVNVELGQYNACHHQVPFEVETSLCERSLADFTENKLYVLDLDDDDKTTDTVTHKLGIFPGQSSGPCGTQPSQNTVF